ncbi:MAG TPA: ParB-like protein [Caulobacteraceae bacterium]|nr:ParB-like protein [Caulobacteraceae bacterium]
MNTREPILHTIPITDLRPTQMTVGYREVRLKRQAWRDRSAERAGEYLGQHMVPTVLGPKQRHYVVDHHHLALALHEEKQKDVLVSVMADLSQLSKSSFWTYLDNRAWCHPYDADGKRRDFDAIPKEIGDLADDPYRSLSGELRRAGGFAKDTTPFSEFLWADFLRSRVSQKAIDTRFGAAVERALSLARSDEASYLPGWCGPHAD